MGLVSTPKSNSYFGRCLTYKTDIFLEASDIFLANSAWMNDSCKHLTIDPVMTIMRFLWAPYQLQKNNSQSERCLTDIADLFLEKCYFYVYIFNELHLNSNSDPIILKHQSILKISM